MVSVLSLFQQLAFDLQLGAETEYFLKETGAFLKRPLFEQGTAEATALISSFSL